MGFIIGYILPFLVLLGVLIFFHELGHFLMAKLFKVGVERFNLGFGRRILKKKWGETEYGLSLIPFGGYVKLVGEHPEEADDLTEEQISRSFMHKPPWQRAVIHFFGPFFNWALAVLIIAVIYMIGYPKPSPVIGFVQSDGPAMAAGLMPGDEIKAVNGEPIRAWDEFVDAVRNSEGREITIDIVRNGKLTTRFVAPELKEGLDRYANKTEIWTIGVDNFPLSTQIGLLGPDTPAGRAGLRTGDFIDEINNTPIKTWHELEQKIASSPGQRLELKVRRPTYKELKGDELDVSFEELAVSALVEPEPGPVSSTIGTLGVAQIGLFLFDVDEDTPAGKAGLRKGDMVSSVDGETLNYREQFNEYIQARPNVPVAIGIVRDSALMTINVTPMSVEQQNILGEITSIGRIGAMFYGGRTIPALHYDRTLNPLKAVYMAMTDTGKITVEMGRFLGALFSGRANIRGLGGPILIAKVAGESAQEGLFTFVMMMAFISINLALVNLLPLPVLDGGQLVLLAVEKLRGRPLPMRYLEWISSIGFGLIVALMVLTMFLDISRFWLPIKKFFTGLM